MKITANLLALKKHTYLLAAGWVMLITVLSLWPISGADTLKSPVPDKVIHSFFYMLFTILWYATLKNRKIKYLLAKIVLLSFVYGIIIEVLQDMMPFGRHFEIKDILANILGALAGAVMIKMYSMRSGIALKKKK